MKQMAHILNFAADMNEQPKIVPLPQSTDSKKVQVAGMFDRISARYDLINRLISFGIDNSWRRKAVKTLLSINPKNILDVATGTGDFALAALKANPDHILGMDISEGMLEVGRKKMAQRGLDKRISMRYGDSENLPLENGSFDAITCAYGVRNFENLEAGLSEMHRVLRAGGKIAILETSHPQRFPFKQLHNLYFRNIMPFVGRLVSKDATAYTYLPESAAAFVEGEAFCSKLCDAGFQDCAARPLTFGVTTLYTATK